VAAVWGKGKDSRLQNPRSTSARPDSALQPALQSPAVPIIQLARFTGVNLDQLRRDPP